METLALKQASLHAAIAELQAFHDSPETEESIQKFKLLNVETHSRSAELHMALISELQWILDRKKSPSQIGN